MSSCERLESFLLTIWFCLCNFQEVQKSLMVNLDLEQEMLLSNMRNEFKKQSYVLNLGLHKKCYCLHEKRVQNGQSESESHVVLLLD